MREMRDVARTASVVAAAFAALASLGCASGSAPPTIAADAPCAICGMSASSARFACERRDGRRWRVFDSIECLVRDKATSSATTVWLPDYDQARLHRADSLWIVKGQLATPMGGGLVAFLDRGSADAVARTSAGRVGRWGDPELVAEGRK